MVEEAKKIVKDYAKEHLGNGSEEFDVYVVWQSKALQNWKFVVSTSLRDGMYYELTYDGDKKEWYLDAYKKLENRVIRA